MSPAEMSDALSLASTNQLISEIVKRSDVAIILTLHDISSDSEQRTAAVYSADSSGNVCDAEETVMDWRVCDLWKWAGYRYGLPVGDEEETDGSETD